MKIRKYQPGDEAAAYYVCLKTGNHGDDGEPYYRDDPDALGRIYVGPYLKFQPEFALVLEDEQGVCGYALAALDSKAFFHCYETQWRSELIKQFPAPSGPPASWNRVQQVHNVYHHPEYTFAEPYDQYPAHLHIDLLPRAQGQGFGTQLIESLLGLLQAAGAVGVYLEMSAENTRAYHFYVKLGFHELKRTDESILMGMKLNNR